MTLREKVARAIDPMAWEEWTSDANGLPVYWEGRRETSLENADAAIFAVFEWLGEPTEARMRAAAVTPWVIDSAEEMFEAFLAMRAAAREEAKG